MPVPLFKLCPTAESLVADAELLGRFTSHRDEAAFAELVRRHGPLVYRICRGSAPCVAEDAFQAVFIALACRAASIRAPEALAGWLVGVAGRIARRMGAAEQRRAEREREAGCNAVPAASHGRAERAELAAALDDELARLPERLRNPLVLCLVCGHTHARAAAELGGSVRTLRRRLERARAVLRARLERRGVVPAVAAALVASAHAPAIAVPPALARKTRAAVFQFLDGGTVAPALVAAKGVTASMTKIKVSAMVVTAATVLVCLGVGWSNERIPAASASLPPATQAGDRTPPSATPPAKPSTPATDPPREVASGSFHGPNFVVQAPTTVMARVIASEAEYHRRTLAIEWLGQELPRWTKPCAIAFVPGPGGNGGATTFTFEKTKAGEPGLASAAMEMRGDFMHALTTTLPHEVMHTVLASYFAKPLPRWADEGIALLSESDEQQAAHDVRARELLAAGRGIRLKVLLPMTEYPKDMIVLYAQGHSLARFLTSPAAPAGVPGLKDLPHVGKLFQTSANRQRLLIAFIRLGTQDTTAESWAKAAKDVYGFKSLDELEEAWLAWLKKPESLMKPKAGSDAPRNEKMPGDDLIPPIKLPRPTAPPALRP